MITGNLFEIAYIANKNNCTSNNFYFARDVRGVENTEREYIEKLSNSEVENGVLYVLKIEDKELLKDANLYCYKIDNYIAVVLEKIEELENKRIIF